VDVRWAIEEAPNPSVLRLHVTTELTSRTILTCPPARAPKPLDRLLDLEGMRSVDLHRYRARLNLAAGVRPERVAISATAELSSVWGVPTSLPPEAPPRAFAVDRTGPRRVAESREMAADDRLLTLMFNLDGVAEAVAGRGMLLLRLARLFRWEDVEPSVVALLAVR
jgi:hypothetical protein